MNTRYGILINRIAALTKDNFEPATIDLTIQAASINTNDVTRDNHLKTADFFDVAQFPDIRFSGTSFDKVANNEYY